MIKEFVLNFPEGDKQKTGEYNGQNVMTIITNMTLTRAYQWTTIIELQTERFGFIQVASEK